MNKQQALKTYIEFYSNKENMIKIYDNASLNRKEFAFYNKSFKNYQMKRHFGICTFEFFFEGSKFLFLLNCFLVGRRLFKKLFLVTVCTAHLIYLFTNQI